MINLSEAVSGLVQSPIRSISNDCAKVGGINLGQGVCNFPIVGSIKHAAHNAIMSDKNAYSACEGVLDLRIALSEKIKRFNQFDVNPETELMVSHGSTGAFVSAVATLFNPGDEVILFEPFYPPHKLILEFYKVSVKTVPICLDDLSFDLADLQKALSKRTKGIVLCTPGNPSGKVFSREELSRIGDFAEKNGLVVICDEIYEHITYPGHEHASLASIKTCHPAVVTISGFSKTYSMTGWRLGYASGPAHIIKKMALVQDLLYVCPVTPLQFGVMNALDLRVGYYEDLKQKYLLKRDYLWNIFKSAGAKVALPQGAYYLFCDVSNIDLQAPEPVEKLFLGKAGVAVVPGDTFFQSQSKNAKYIRACFALDDSELQAAGFRIEQSFKLGF